MWKSAMSRVKPSNDVIMGAAKALKNTSPPMMVRLKMMVKLSKILGPPSSRAGRSPRVLNTKAKPNTRGRQARIMKKMRTALGKKSKPCKKFKKPKSELWEKAQEASIPIRPSWDLFIPEMAEPESEPEYTIELTSSVVRTRTYQIVYDFNSGIYEELETDDVLLDLLTLPSKVALKEDLERYRMKFRMFGYHSEDSDLEDVLDDSRREMEELYEGVVSKEELARIDAQPNPFNFSDRVSQTTKIFYKDLGMQTEPPPDTKYSLTVGPGQIHEVYAKHEQELERRQMEKEEKEKERERGKKVVKDPLQVLGMGAIKQKQQKTGLLNLVRAARVVERMVTQNIYDDILQDFKYWEDGSDEYRPLQGSLLPLWRFRPDECRKYTVTAVATSPILQDLFAAAYTNNVDMSEDCSGMVCIYSLKNPSCPETIFHTKAGATTLHFHPTIVCLLAAGCNDGCVCIYDVSPHSIHARTHHTPLYSTTTTGKHLLPVTKVEWLYSEQGDEPRLVSVSLDGRVTLWRLPGLSALHNTDLLQLRAKHHDQHNTDAIPLGGVPTSLAVHPEKSNIILIGLDSGHVYECSITCLPHSLYPYHAHGSPVTILAWNQRHPSLFLSASLDWCIKIWAQHFQTALVVVDCGGSVAGAVWSPYNSSVILAVTDDCKAHVFDLLARRCTAVCVQALAQKRHLTAASITISPFYPIVLIGGDRGHLASFKLSPNLRPVCNEGNDGDGGSVARDVERSRMDTLIRTSKG